MTKWIYKWEPIDSYSDMERVLNSYGEEGWELCGAHSGRYILKMPKPKEKKVVREDSNIEGVVNMIIKRLNETTKSQYSIMACSTRKCITARLNEGKTVKDFFDVIEAKYNEWKDTDMAQYLRPETLFGNKFEGYLQYAKANKPKEPENPNMKGMVL